MDSESSKECSSSQDSFLISFTEEDDADKRKTNPIQTPRQKNKQIYGSFKNKLKDVLPAVFKKDAARGDFIFDSKYDLNSISISIYL